MKEYNTIKEAATASKQFNDLHIQNGFPNMKKFVYPIENGKYIVAGPLKAKLYTRNTEPINTK